MLMEASWGEYVKRIDDSEEQTDGGRWVNVLRVKQNGEGSSFSAC